MYMSFHIFVIIIYSQTCVNGHLWTTATSEQRPPVNNGRTKSGQANFDTNIDWKPSTERPPLYNAHFFGVPRVTVVDRFDCIYQGWPDFFSHGPFSIIWNVLLGGRGVQFFFNFSADLWRIIKGSKIFLQKLSFFSLKLNIFFKNGIIGGVFFKKFEPPLSSRAAKKVWWAACGPLAALWPCLVYTMGLINDQSINQL